MQIQFEIRIGKQTSSGIRVLINIKKGKVNQNEHHKEIGIANHHVDDDWKGNANINGN